MSVKSWFGCKCAGVALYLIIKLKVEIRLEDVKPIVGFPVADPNKITSLRQCPVECGMLSPHIAASFGGWGSAQHLEFGQVKVPSALLGEDIQGWRRSFYFYSQQ